MAIAVVYVAHAGLSAVPGGLGVTAFFFLSGYLITTLLRREFESTGQVAYRQFYWRRAWRILPPMYVALAFGTIVSLLGLTSPDDAPRADAAGVALQGLHLSNYAQLTRFADGIPGGTGVFWSLAIEEHFYLLFPVCAVFLMRRFDRRSQAAILVGVCGLVLAWRIVLIAVFDATSDRTYLATDTRIDAILFGCAMGLWGNPMLDRVPRPKASVATAASLAALAVIVGSVAIRGDFFQTTVVYTIQSAALIPLFFFAVQRPDLWLFKPLNHRWVMFVGVLSYSFYLLHHVVLFIAFFGVPREFLPALRVLGAPISLGLSYLVYLAVEQPAARMRKRHAVTVPTVEGASTGP